MSQGAEYGLNQAPPSVLFITRKFPPSVGGMETVAYELHSSLVAEGVVVRLVKWGGSNKALPFVLPLHFFRSFFYLLTSNYDVIYIQDAVLLPIGVILKKVFRKPLVLTVHGLDVTYRNHFYQFLVKHLIELPNEVVAVSEGTKSLLEGDKVKVIPNGVNDEFNLNKFDAKAALPTDVRLKIKGRRVLFTSGRLVKRKGVVWFINSVMPRLVEKDNKIIYIVAGRGKEYRLIQEAIIRNELRSNVMLLGYVGDKTLNALYNLSDLFIMPNISVAGDKEGFGVVAIEAASCGTPVVASNIEGINEAVHNKKNGFLVEAENAEEFCSTISKLLDDRKSLTSFRKKCRDFTLKNFNWSKIAKSYLEIFKAVSE